MKRELGLLIILVVVVMLLGLGVVGVVANSNLRKEVSSGEVTLDSLEGRGILTSEFVEKIRDNPNKKERVIVTFYEKPDNYKSDIRGFGGEVVYDYNLIEGLAVELPLASVENLGRLKNIKKIEEDEILNLTLSESIPLINADDVHTLTPTSYDGTGVKICILDTGIDDSHPAFPPGTVIGEWDFYNGDSDASDTNGHGTHVAGIVASRDATYTGVAPGSSLLIGKVCEGVCPSSDIIAGVDWCADNDADVISMSIGGGHYTTYCDDAVAAEIINNAVDLGIFVSIASGNNGYIDGINYPACASKAVSVGDTYDDSYVFIRWGGTPPTCTDEYVNADDIVCHSNRGSILDLLAPGALTMSANYNWETGDDFVNMGGTSMATPHVAGLAALLKEKYPSIKPAEILEKMKDTGISIYDDDNSGGDGPGSGLTFPRIDALAAIQTGHLEPYIITLDMNAPQNQLFDFSVGVECVGGNCGNVLAYLDPTPFCTESPCVVDDTSIGCMHNDEPDYPTTIDSCVDGEEGLCYTYGGNVDESVENIIITDLDGTQFIGGDELEVSVDVFCADWEGYTYYLDDEIVVLYTSNGGVNWRLIGHVNSCPAAGLNTFTNRFILDDVTGTHTIRAFIVYIMSKTAYNYICGDTAGYFGPPISGSWSDTDDVSIQVNAGKGIIPESSGTPFYTTSSQPQSCGSMSAGDTCNLTWNVNATGDIGETYRFYGIFESDILNTQVESPKVDVTISEVSEVIDITFVGGPIDFGNLDPNQEGAAAGNGNFYVTVELTTTVSVDLYQKGDNYNCDFGSTPSCTGESITIDNMKWNKDGGPTKSSVESSYTDPIYSDVGTGDHPIYYWLDIPAGKAAGDYDSTVYFNAVSAGESAPLSVSSMSMKTLTSKPETTTTQETTTPPPQTEEPTLEQEEKQEETIQLNEQEKEIIKLN